MSGSSELKGKSWPEDVVEKDNTAEDLEGLMALDEQTLEESRAAFVELCKQCDSLRTLLMPVVDTLKHPQFKRTPLRGQVQSVLHLHDAMGRSLIRVGTNLGFCTVVPRGTQPTERGEDPAPQEKTPED